MSESDWSISPPLPKLEFHWEEGKDPQTPQEVNQFFYSDALQVIKQRIVAIGQRMWQKDYVDGNGGNISVRVGDNLVLCTPTLISKGFMTPDDMCLVDMQGRQKAGKRPSTSEIKTHLGIMSRVPAAKSCVHAHPVHANAFVVTGTVPPTGIMPEPDIFFGEVVQAKYATPGTPENAENVGSVSPDHQCIFMENHGVIVWGNHVEDAYWKLENVDSYCRILLLATQLNIPIQQVNAASMNDFIALRKKLGMPDNRDQRSAETLFNLREFAGRALKAHPEA
ncbi:class II aldolase family protein [Chimaeribacter californicus]|uniref:Class II aldolase family protein n=1 Tax=Chimaeribacter californicus TaxID=2060067 RepID=A0A2N5EFH3_9GAMM|nr:class II aldolase/adducin family protein [Chimaeribacter californicus]PLR41270.1 class II aldolase family protein [Chimaeribacter californicus]